MVLNTENHNYEGCVVKTSKELLGENVQFTFEYVTEIPKLRSGKFRMTVCMIPEKGQ